MPFSGQIRSDLDWSVVTCKKSLLSMFFAVFININIFKCIQVALYIILVKKKIQLSKGIGQFQVWSGD